MRLPSRNNKRQVAVCMVTLCAWFGSVHAQDAQDVREQIVENQAAVMLETEGSVSFQRKQAPERLVQKVPHVLNLGDSASTSNSSRAVLLMLDRSSLRLRELTRFQLQPRLGRTN